jgi:hypothetical protein
VDPNLFVLSQIALHETCLYLRQDIPFSIRARWGLSQVADFFAAYMFTVKGMTSRGIERVFALNQDQGD